MNNQMTIRNLINSYAVQASGFPAIAGLGALSKGVEPAVLSSLSPAILYAQGVRDFWALEIPRGSVFNSPQDILDADLPVRRYTVSEADKSGLDTVIVSQHAGTVAILRDTYPDAPALASVTPADVTGKHVIGTLPPHLITAAAAYTAVTIRNFNYAVDSDLNGSELLERIQIAEQAIVVREI